MLTSKASCIGYAIVKTACSVVNADGGLAVGGPAFNEGRDEDFRGRFVMKTDAFLFFSFSLFFSLFSLGAGIRLGLGFGPYT